MNTLINHFCSVRFGFRIILQAYVDTSVLCIFDIGGISRCVNEVYVARSVRVDPTAVCIRASFALVQ